MHRLFLAFLVALSASPALLSQEISVRPRTREASKPSADPFVGIGRLAVEAVLEGGGRTSTEAPSLDELVAAAKQSLGDFEGRGSLPATLVVRMNAFKSKVNGDTVFSLHYEIRRPCSILGTTEIVQAPVWSENAVGRSNESGAKNFILKTLRESIKESLIPKLIPDPVATQ